MSSREDLPTYLGTRKVLACGPRALREKKLPPSWDGACASASSFLIALKVRKIVFSEGERNFPKIFFWTIIEAIDDTLE